MPVIVNRTEVGGPIVSMYVRFKDKEVHPCEKCPIDFDPVPPDGDRSAPIWLVGEVPGGEEQKAKVPFVGPAGQLLRKGLSLAGIDPFCLWNVTLCRTTNEQGNNRTPTFEESRNCSKYAKVLIKEGAPKVLVLLGKTALHAFFPTGEFSPTVDKMHMAIGHTFQWMGIPTFACYHPSYILRHGGLNASEGQAWVGRLKAIRNYATDAEFIDEVPF